MNVERAYREFRNEPPDAPWDQAATFDAIYQVAKAKDIPVESSWARAAPIVTADQGCSHVVQPAQATHVPAERPAIEALLPVLHCLARNLPQEMPRRCPAWGRDREVVVKLKSNYY